MIFSDGYRMWEESLIDTTGMSWPMRCKHCRNVHDAGKVEVLQRYMDCSVWRCPSCNILGDDRPLSWGGSFERYPADDNR